MSAMSRTLTTPRMQSGRARMPILTASRVCVRESYDGSQKLRVDRERGIVYGVKVLGRESPNTHGKPVDGTRYEREAIRSALPIIEGRRVYANHRTPRNSTADRRIEDRLGKLVAAREDGGEAYADLHLVRTHPLAESILWAAEHMPDAYCLSIDADGHGEIKNRRLVIDRILEIRSVDVVAEGGTTTSLSESKKGKAMSKTLKESLVALKLKESTITKLFEMYEGSAAPLLQPDAAPDVPAGGDDNDPKTHLGKAMVAFMNDDTMDPDTKKKKILALLKILDDNAAPEGDVVDATESDMDGDEGDDTKKKKKGEETPMKESLETKVRRLERTAHVRTLCDAAGYVPTPTQLKSLVALDADAEVSELIESLQSVPVKSEGDKPAGAKGTGLPRTAGGGRTTITESAAPKSAKECLARLFRA